MASTRSFSRFSFATIFGSYRSDTVLGRVAMGGQTVVAVGRFETDGIDGGTFFIVEVVIVFTVANASICAALFPVFMKNLKFASMSNTFLDGGLASLHDFHPGILLKTSYEKLMFEKTFRFFDFFILDSCLSCGGCTPVGVDRCDHGRLGLAHFLECIRHTLIIIRNIFCVTLDQVLNLGA